MRGRPHDALGVEGVGDPLPLLRWSMMHCADRGIEVKRGPRTSLSFEPVLGDLCLLSEEKNVENGVGLPVQ